MTGDGNAREVSLTVDAGIATLTLRRPERRNALSDEMVTEIAGACRQVSDRDEVSVLVITGEGTSFCAGGDVKQMQAGVGMFGGTPDEITEAYRRGVQQLPRILAELDVVTIAAVNGPAIGAGCDLALMCDLRLAATSARFGETFVNLGLVPGDGGAWFLPRAVGWQRAVELALTGRVIDAPEALEIGLVLEVVDDEGLMERATALATQIAAKPAHAVRLGKRLLRLARDARLAEVLELSAAYQAASHHTPAHRAAVDALFEQTVKKQR